MARKTDKPAKPAKPAKTVRPNPRDGRYLADAREAGTTWPAILEATGAKSAIPLRATLARFLRSDAKNAERYPTEYAKVDKAPATPTEVVRRRDELGEGFPRIAARTGLSVPKVRELYAKGNGLSADGRVYVGSAGRTLVLRPGESAPIAAKAAKKGRKAAAKAKAAKAARKAAKAA